MNFSELATSVSINRWCKRHGYTHSSCFVISPDFVEACVVNHGFEIQRLDKYTSSFSQMYLQMPVYTCIQACFTSHNDPTIILYSSDE